MANLDTMDARKLQECLDSVQRGYREIERGDVESAARILAQLKTQYQQSIAQSRTQSAA